MNQTITAFDCQFPYRLTEENSTRIRQVKSSLGVLVCLTGAVAAKDRYEAPDFSALEFHEMLWALWESLDTVAAALEKQDKSALAQNISTQRRTT